MNKHIPSRQAKRIWRIVEMIDRRDVIGLATILEKGNEPERIAVLVGLTRIDNDELFELAPFVTKQLKHASPCVRLAALRANIHFRYFNPAAMLQLVDDPSPAVIDEIITKMRSVDARDSAWWAALVKIIERRYPNISMDLAYLIYDRKPGEVCLPIVSIALRLAKHRNLRIRGNVLSFLAGLNDRLTPAPITLEDAERIVDYSEYGWDVIELLKPYGRAAYPVINKLKHHGIRAIVQMELMANDKDFTPRFSPAQYRYIVQKQFRPTIKGDIFYNIIRPGLIKAALTEVRSNDRERHRDSIIYLREIDAHSELEILKESTYSDLNSPHASKRQLALLNVLHLNMRETIDQVMALCTDEHPAVSRLAFWILEDYASKGIPAAKQRLVALANDTACPQRDAALSELFGYGSAAPYKRDCAIRVVRELHPVMLNRFTDESIADGRAFADRSIVRSLAYDVPKSHITAMLRHTNLKFRLVAYDSMRYYCESKHRHSGKSVRLPAQWLDALRHAFMHANEMESRLASCCIDDSWPEQQILAVLLPLLQDGTRSRRANAVAILLRCLYDGILHPLQLIVPLIDTLDRLSDTSTANVVGFLRSYLSRPQWRNIIKSQALAIATYGSAASREILAKEFPEFGYDIAKAFSHRAKSKVGSKSA